MLANFDVQVIKLDELPETIKDRIKGGDNPSYRGRKFNPNLLLMAPYFHQSSDAIRITWESPAVRKPLSGKFIVPKLGSDRVRFSKLRQQVIHIGDQDVQIAGEVAVKQSFCSLFLERLQKRPDLHGQTLNSGDLTLHIIQDSQPEIIVFQEGGFLKSAVTQFLVADTEISERRVQETFHAQGFRSATEAYQLLMPLITAGITFPHLLDRGVSRTNGHHARYQGLEIQDSVSPRIPARPIPPSGCAKNDGQHQPHRDRDACKHLKSTPVMFLHSSSPDARVRRKDNHASVEFATRSAA